MEILSTVFMPDARVFGDLAAHRRIVTITSCIEMFTPSDHHASIRSFTSSTSYREFGDLILSPSLFSISFYYYCFFMLLFATNNGNPVVDFLVFSTVIIR